ncbi:DUF6090 family protein [uncultured Aquimarina sp.]|uniref:DUF6090 family protein n=1 Tax=uncultured Aquimarina sp. TaxID=575652 RepID=UPI002635392B|nr:DUF6090 family protein [uncultured Aquimarina sp.]
MIKLFRKIRQNLLSENKFSKYLLYAIGEIVLVVIGILIALQISNLNEQSKKEDLRKNYVNSLKKDLESDIVLLEKQISQFASELKIHKSLSERMSASNANFDTIRKIARYEFHPFFSPSNNLNFSTYNALISTGNLDLLQTDIREKIQKHNAEQIETLETIELNFKLCAELGYKYTNNYPINIEFNAINGKQMNSVWEEINENKLKTNLNGILTNKITNYNMTNRVRQRLVDKTKILIEEIISSEK